MKKKFQMFFVLVFVLSLVVLDVPASHSKYKTTDNNAINYDISLYRLKGQMDQVSLLNSAPYRTDYKTAYFSFSFSRNPIGEVTKDKYVITGLPNACSIVSITPGLNGTVSNNEISYDYTSISENPSTTAIVKCDIDSMPKYLNAERKEYFEFHVNILENVDEEKLDNGDPLQFTYINFSKKYKLEDYYQMYPRPPVDKLELKGSTKEKQSKLIDWIDAKFAQEDASIAALVYFYVLDQYPDDMDESNFFDISLPGLTIESEMKNGELVYTYSILENSNIVGYAKTYDESDIADRYMYFTTNSPFELEIAFDYYLNEYVFDLQNEDAQIKEEQQKKYDQLNSYINSFSEQGISYIMLPNEDGTYNTIPGFDYDTQKGMLQLLTPNIYDYAFNSEKEHIRLSWASESSMTYVFQKSLELFYADIFSPSFLDSLTTLFEGDSEFKNSIIKNNSLILEKENFSDYQVLYDSDNNKYFIFHIYADTTNDEENKYNYIDIVELEFVEEEIDQLILVNENKEEFEFIVKALDKYFEQEETVIKEEDIVEIKETIEEEEFISYKYIYKILNLPVLPEDVLDNVNENDFITLE